jgi:eukaryotic-like serine/threonine-protein kinase
MLRLCVVEARADDRGQATRRVGRYALFGEIASGGMATVYFGRLVGAVGFSRSVAIKQLHPQFARSPEFVAQFLDEAQITARIRHPNVVSVLDVVAREGELFVIMEFVEGEPLSRLVRFSSAPIPMTIASAILVQILLGLHAAHEATSENGEPLEIVHRDVSPQNMLVGIDGTSHILDFGVAKAASRVHTTENGQIKGKLSYMAPEQLRGADLDRRVDVFAAGIVLWELLAGERLFARSDPGATVTAVLAGEVKPPSQFRPEVSAALDALVLKALAPAVEDRFASAREMAIALENCVPPASSLKVGAWVESVAGASLKERAQRLREAEEHTGINAVVDVEGLQKRLADAQLSFPARDSDGRISISDRVASAPPGSTGEATTQPVGGSNWARREEASPWFMRGALLAAALLAVVLGVLLLRRTAPHEAQPLASAAAQTTQSAAPSASIPEAPPSVVQADDLPQIAADPSSTASSPPAASSGSALAATPTKVTRKAATKTSRPPADCVPPYVLDAQGRKRFKPECF